MQSKNQVLILSISIFEKPEQTIDSNCSADRVNIFYKLEKMSSLLHLQQFYNVLQQYSFTTLWAFGPEIKTLSQR